VACMGVGCLRGFGWEARREETTGEKREDNIKMDLRERGYKPMASFCEPGNEPLGSLKKEGCSLTS
jgi:hypothetical protein